MSFINCFFLLFLTLINLFYFCNFFVKSFFFSTMSTRFFLLFHDKLLKVFIFALFVIFARSYLCTLFRSTVAVFETPVPVLEFWRFCVWVLFIFCTWGGRCLIIGRLKVPISALGMLWNWVDNFAGARVTAVLIVAAEDMSVGRFEEVLLLLGLNVVIECKILVFWNLGMLRSRWWFG